MRHTIYVILSHLLLLTACHDDPKHLLTKAQDKINHSAFVSYKHTALWPNPVGKVDTMQGSSAFYKNDNTYFSYDYIGTGTGDVIYIDNEFKRVDHNDSIVFIYSKEDLKKEKSYISGSLYVRYSPITFLNQASWQYVQDTTIQGQILGDYRQIETDTIIDNNQIYVERHIFINPASALLERFERRNYVNGKNSQTVVYNFSDYKLLQESEPFAYELPQNYTSQVFGNREKVTLLEVGQEAPNFNVKDINGNTLNLEKLRGKKVLIDFSTINCGYCKLALDHFNQEDYRISDEISGIYINPVDDKSAVLDYVDKIPVPFPVIAGAKDIGKMYGVSAFPTFFLIDEEGMIEKVIKGYHKDFLESIKNTQM